MLGTRQVSALSAGRSVLALSVLALLAFGCFPLLAQADSSGIEYSDAPPTVTGSHSIPKQSEPPAHSSKKNGGAPAQGSGGSPGKGSSGGGPSSHSGGGAGPGAEGGTGKQGSQGNGSGGSGGKAAKPVGGKAEPASSQSDSGSSPLVPILIAIAVLAAISIGALIVRQRRRSSSTPVSPEAG